MLKCQHIRAFNKELWQFLRRLFKRGGAHIVGSGRSELPSVASEEDVCSTACDYAETLFNCIRDGSKRGMKWLAHCEAVPCRNDLKECCEKHNPCWAYCECCDGCLSCVGDAGGIVVALIASEFLFCGYCAYRGGKAAHKRCREKEKKKNKEAHAQAFARFTEAPRQQSMHASPPARGVVYHPGAACTSWCNLATTHTQQLQQKQK